MATSVRRNIFLVDNAHSGFDLRELSTGGYIRTYPTGTPSRRLPKQVTFGENAKSVVGGSDHGVVYIFERKTGVLRESLPHQNGGLVQTVAVNTLSYSKRYLQTDECYRFMMGRKGVLL